MTDSALLVLSKDALLTAFWIAGPMLLAALVVGIAISLVQVATSVQDQTLSAVPKLAAVLAAFLLSLHWITHTIVTYTARILQSIPEIALR